MSEDEVLSLMDEAFRAGQERMRNRAALRMTLFIPLQDAELVRLGGEAADQILNMEIVGIAEARKRMSESDEQAMARIRDRYSPK